MNIKNIKDFEAHRNDGDEILEFTFPMVNGDNPVNFDCVHASHGWNGCRFYLSRETGQSAYVHWIVAMKDGKEVERWNTAHIESIKWKVEA